MLRAAARVKAADLEQALLMLPFHDALRLLGYLRDGLASGSEVHSCCPWLLGRMLATFAAWACAGD